MKNYSQLRFLYPLSTTAFVGYTLYKIKVDVKWYVFHMIKR